MYADRPTKLEFSGRAANGDPFPMLISLSLVIVEVKENGIGVWVRASISRCG
jgi:hypothetical protein